MLFPHPQRRRNGMPRSLIDRVVTVRQGAYLPHGTLRGATYAVCFRLADSLPQEVAEAWRRECTAMREEAGANPTVEKQERMRELFAERIEQYLDHARGACWLRRPEIAEMVGNTLRHFDEQRYQLIAWCLMPNHVHVVVRPLGNHTLSGILKSWKGFSGKEANRLLHRQGAFWQPEYHDHLVRDARDLEHAVRYLMENPVKAWLSDWPWVWVGEQAKTHLERNLPNANHGSGDP